MRSFQQTNFGTRHTMTRVSATNVFWHRIWHRSAREAGRREGTDNPAIGAQPPISTDLKGQSRTRRNSAERLFPLFKTGALNRSATHPRCACYSARGGWYRCRLPP